MLSIPGIQQHFSAKTFGFGLIGVALLYLALFAYAAIKKDYTYASFESRLASQTVLIDRPETFVRTQAAIETTDTLEEGDLAEAPPGEETTQESAEQSEEEDLENIVSKQALSLRESPVPGFYEETQFGLLPVAKSPAQTPFQVYKKPFVLNHDKPYLAVAVENFGLSAELSQQMIDELPSSVSFILSPYSSQPDKWTQKARQDGHEIWLHLPMENNDFPLMDPGAKGLLTRVSLQYNQDRLQWVLGRATGYAGIAAYTDNALDNAGPMFRDIAKDVFKRGLGFFELNNELGSFFTPLADESKAPNTQNDLTLDLISLQNPDLKRLLSNVKGQGKGTLLVSPTSRNIPTLKKWLESLQKRGIEPIPISAAAAPDLERN